MSMLNSHWKPLEWESPEWEPPEWEPPKGVSRELQGTRERRSI
jgi:hypothetical protein